ncbi:MAG: hypothetical protein A3K04_12035 [Gallionellales bacterium RBG_16_56_9]|nr:MAG: hypothetical protein A3K04_12035 [Gallionellales bacterium RBG_16_56_9]
MRPYTIYKVEVFVEFPFFFLMKPVTEARHGELKTSDFLTQGLLDNEPGTKKKFPELDEDSL